MDRRTQRPLTVEQAKARLLDAAVPSEPAALLRRHRAATLALAAGAGFLFARSHALRRLAMTLLLKAL